MPQTKSTVQQTSFSNILKCEDILQKYIPIKFHRAEPNDNVITDHKRFSSSICVAKWKLSELIFNTLKVVTNEKGEAVGDVLTIIC